MQLTEKTFSRFLAAFLKYRLNFKHFERKMTLIDLVFPKLRTGKAWSDKGLKSHAGEDPSRSNMENVSKNC